MKSSTKRRKKKSKISKISTKKSFIEKLCRDNIMKNRCTNKNKK